MALGDQRCRMSHGRTVAICSVQQHSLQGAAAAPGIVSQCGVVSKAPLLCSRALAGVRQLAASAIHDELRDGLRDKPSTAAVAVGKRPKPLFAAPPVAPANVVAHEEARTGAGQPADDSVIARLIMAARKLDDVESLLQKYGRRFRSQHVAQLLICLPAIGLDGPNSEARRSRIVRYAATRLVCACAHADQWLVARSVAT